MAFKATRDFNAGRKKKPRLKSTRDLDLFKMYGEEPKWTGKSVEDEDYDTKYSAALNWANRGVEHKEARIELLFWMEANKYSKQNIRAVKMLPDWKLSTAGQIAFLANNNWPLTDRSDSWLKEQIADGIITGMIMYKEKEAKEKTIKIKKENVESAEIINAKQAQEIADELEEAIFNTFKVDEQRVQALSRGSKALVLAKAIDKLNSLKDEAALIGSDKQVTEAYSHIKAPKVKNILKALETSMSILEGAKINKKATRKTRKSKPKSAAIQVQKVQHKKSDSVYNIVSVDPINIVGATKVTMFNTKTRKLVIFYSKDASGFNIKGTTLQNYDEKISEQKTLRDTKDSSINDKLVSFRKAPVKKVDKMFADLTTTNTKAKGRINKDIVILKVYK